MLPTSSPPPFTLAFACAAIAGLSLVAPPRAEASPAIEITELPAYGSDGFMQGSVTGVDPAAHRVAPYIYIDGAGWFTKPTFESPTVPIAGDGSFSADVVTGGIDEHAVILCAALVDDGTPPPQANGAVRIPASLQSLALECVERPGRTFAFADYTWRVKEAPLPVGPGANRFASDSASVWVDAQGLHLRVRFDGTHWSSAEVELIDPLGYGRLAIRTASRLDTLDANVTFGAFLWDSYGDGSASNPNREFDVEDGRWGNASDPDDAQFVVQPYTTSGNLDRYAVPDQSGDAALTRVLEWLPEALHFTALTGHHGPTALPPASVLHEFAYEHDPAQNHFVPTPGRARLHLNLWLNGGAAQPVSGQTVEVTIQGVEFAAPPSVPATESDAARVTLGAGLLMCAGVALAAAGRRRPMDLRIGR